MGYRGELVELGSGSGLGEPDIGSFWDDLGDVAGSVAGTIVGGGSVSFDLGSIVTNAIPGVIKTVGGVVSGGTKTPAPPQQYYSPPTPAPVGSWITQLANQPPPQPASLPYYLQPPPAPTPAPAPANDTITTAHLIAALTAAQAPAAKPGITPVQMAAGVGAAGAIAFVLWRMGSKK